MRSLQYLKAAIYTICGRHSDHNTHHTWEKEAILIPITIILMPFPGTSDTWFLLHYFSVIQSCSSTEQHFNSIDNIFVFGECTVNILTVVIPQCQFCLSTSRIFPAESVFLNIFILDGSFK